MRLQYARRVPLSSRRLLFASLRASQWGHFAFLPWMGVERGRPVPWGSVALALTSAAGSLAFAYGLNAVVERGTDRSAQKNPLVARPAEAPAVLRLVLLCALLAFAGSALLGTWAAACMLVSLACGALYSVGLRAKHIPFVGLVFNAGIFVPLGLLLLSGRSGRAWVAELALFGSLLTQNQLAHELADAAEDRAAGARTTAGLLGRRGARVAMGLVGFAGLAGVAGQRVERVAIALVTCLVCALVVVVARRPARARRLHRYAALAGGAALHGVSWWGA